MINGKHNLQIFANHIQIYITDKMTSVEKRKNLVNELRKAHFPFGFQGNKNPSSQYIEKYRQYEIQRSKLDKNNRGNKLQIGDGAQNNYKSQFQDRFPQHALPEKQRHKPNDNNNIVLGYDGNSDRTSYHDHYPLHPSTLPNPRQQPHHKTNIELGDALTDFASTYNVVHNTKDLLKTIPSGQDIRKTNMVLGNDPTNYLTQNNFSYQGQPVASHAKINKDYGSNVTLGGDKQPFVTQAKEKYSHKQGNSSTVDKALIRDFKSAHFHFGFPTTNPNNQSEAAAQYSEKPINFVKVGANLTPNVQLRSDENNYYDTTYAKQFVGKEGEKRGPIVKNGQIDSVLMGTNPNQYQSEARAQFNDKLSSREKANMKKHPNSLDFGKYPASFTTQYQDSHYDKFKDLTANKLSEEQIMKLKGKNYVEGFSNNNYGLSSQKYGERIGDYVQGSYKPKISNLVTEPILFDGKTIYKSSFPWKKSDQ